MRSFLINFEFRIIIFLDYSCITFLDKLNVTAIISVIRNIIFKSYWVCSIILSNSKEPKSEICRIYTISSWTSYFFNTFNKNFLSLFKRLLSESKNWCGDSASNNTWLRIFYLININTITVINGLHSNWFDREPICWELNIKISNRSTINFCSDISRVNNFSSISIDKHYIWCRSIILSTKYNFNIVNCVGICQEYFLRNNSRRSYSIIWWIFITFISKFIGNNISNAIRNWNNKCTSTISRFNSSKHWKWLHAISLWYDVKVFNSTSSCLRFCSILNYITIFFQVY